MRYLVFSILLLFIPTSALAEMVIQNDQMYLGSDGIMHIAGEVQNNLKVPLNKLIVTAIMYSEDGVEIAKSTARSPINNIMPEMSAPFDILVPTNVENIARYSLDIEYTLGSAKDRSIGVASSTMYHDEIGNLAVSGSLVNNGQSTANMVKVIATVYDSDGDVAGVSSLHVKPDYLRSSEEVHFVMGVHYPAKDVSHYTVVAESEEFAAVPEFPASSMLLLAGCVAWYLALGRKMSILKQPI